MKPLLVFDYPWQVLFTIGTMVEERTCSIMKFLVFGGQGVTLFIIDYSLLPFPMAMSNLSHVVWLFISNFSCSPWFCILTTRYVYFSFLCLSRFTILLYAFINSTSTLWLSHCIWTLMSLALMPYLIIYILTSIESFSNLHWSLSQRITISSPYNLSSDSLWDVILIHLTGAHHSCLNLFIGVILL